MQAIIITILLATFWTSSVLGQECKNYVVASGNLVEKSKVKELTGVLRQKNLWITGADRQTHSACVIQLTDSTHGVFVMDYRPTTAIGSKVRISAVKMADVAHPALEVRTGSGTLDNLIDGNLSTKCYAVARDATAIDYDIAQKKKQLVAQ